MPGSDYSLRKVRAGVIIHDLAFVRANVTLMLCLNLYLCRIRCKVGIRVRVGLMIALDLCSNTDQRSC